jgi:hypothetical protein
LINKKTVFVLGAGASCPYGYPSGALLRKRICLSQGLWQDYNAYRPPNFSGTEKEAKLKEIEQFKDAFNKSRIKSIDLFIANNSKLAPIGKYIIAFEIFRAERRSLFGEEAKFQQEQVLYLQNHGRRGPQDLLSGPFFLGDDWYSYLYNRIIDGANGKDALPDFSNGNLTFITFNYDRSLEQFLYEALRNSFTEVEEDKIIQSLRKLKILHVYGQTAFLKWQHPSDCVDYKTQINESLLERAAKNIRTIFEEKQNEELTAAQHVLEQAENVFFLGFGYAQENLEVLNLPRILSPTVQIYGTALYLEANEIDYVQRKIHDSVPPTKTGYKHQYNVRIENMDCLKLLRNHS